MIHMKLTLRARHLELSFWPLLVVGLAHLFYETIHMPMGKINLPGAGVFPLALIIPMVLMAIYRVTWLLTHKDEDTESIVLGDKNIFLALAGLVGIALLLDLLGFVITMGMFLFVTFKVFTESSWLKSALRAALTVIGLYVFFEYLIGVTLPMGPLIAL
jgi:hypothetical protein